MDAVGSPSVSTTRSNPGGIEKSRNMAINIFALWSELLNGPHDNPLLLLSPFLAVQLPCTAHAVSSPRAGFMLSHVECQGREQRSTGAYQPRDPEQTLVYRVLQENLETFLARQQENGRHVPRFVEKCGTPHFSTNAGPGRSRSCRLARNVSRFCATTEQSTVDSGLRGQYADVVSCMRLG